MYCPRCGTKTEGHQRYCPSCGELLDADVNMADQIKRDEGFGTGAVRQINSVGTFFRNNIFRLAVAVIMIIVSVILIRTFIDEFGVAFSCLSGLEKWRAAIGAVIYVLAVFIPVLLSLESIRESFFISARLNPKEFNIRRYAIRKGALLPMAIDLAACLALVITPLILYNYKENDLLASITIILEKYQTPAIICCVLCAVSLVLIIVSRKRITQEKAFIRS